VAVVNYYRDKDGDIWNRLPFGRYGMWGNEDVSRTLSDLEISYGPLTALDDAMKESPVNDSPSQPPLSREEALKVATQHVTALSTNARGFQDGVSFKDRVDAVERLARFLAGER
jgi:hypothetical protein